MNPTKRNGLLLAVALLPGWGHAGERQAAVLSTEKLASYVTQFNADDEELYSNIKNKDAYAFLEKNIPLFECPDEDVERTWYFRWWTYRKHIKSTDDGYVVTEFMPKVPWSGKHNTINCPAAHHFYEGRWLHDPQYLDDYATFWLRKGGSLRSYSFWIADAYLNRNLVTPNDAFLIDLLPDLVKNYEAWEEGWEWGGHRIGRRENGMFYTIDDRDGGEVSIGGHGFRPTLNSFMYGDARAIAEIARMAGETALAEQYQDMAATLKQLVQEKLWDGEAQFFKILPEMGGKLTDVRELYGYTPWYFNLPDPGYEAGWSQLMDPKGFYAPYGPTFAEQRHPRFRISYEGHECQWNGPSWPLATCSVLTGLANLLNNYDQDVIGKDAYFETLKIYTKSHQLKRVNGKVVPWIDENLNPYTGDWISRTRLLEMEKTNSELFIRKGGYERGKDYNHSTYNDLIITGLVGLRPRADDIVEVNPLLPENTWDWFCLDNVLYHGRILTILWDKTGEKYGKGKGLTVLADGKKIAHAETLSRVTGELGHVPPVQTRAPGSGTLRPNLFRRFVGESVSPASITPSAPARSRRNMNRRDKIAIFITSKGMFRELAQRLTHIPFIRLSDLYQAICLWLFESSFSFSRHGPGGPCHGAPRSFQMPNPATHAEPGFPGLLLGQGHGGVSGSNPL